MCKSLLDRNESVNLCAMLSLTVLLVIVHPEVKNWIKYAKFEEKHSYINSARSIYERAVEFFGEHNVDEKLLIAFAKFEEGQKEVHTYSSIRMIRN